MRASGSRRPTSGPLGEPVLPAVDRDPAKNSVMNQTAVYFRKPALCRQHFPMTRSRIYGPDRGGDRRRPGTRRGSSRAAWRGKVPRSCSQRGPSPTSTASRPRLPPQTAARSSSRRTFAMSRRRGPERRSAVRGGRAHGAALGTEQGGLGRHVARRASRASLRSTGSSRRAKSPALRSCSPLMALGGHRRGCQRLGRHRQFRLKPLSARRSSK